MKRRSLLAGGLLGGLVTVLGVKGVQVTEPVGAALVVATPEPVTEKLIDSGPYHGSYDWSGEMEEARIEMSIERIKQTPWYQSYMDQRVMEHLGIPAPNLITHRYVTYPMMGEIANRGGYSIEHVEREIAKSLT